MRVQRGGKPLNTQPHRAQGTIVWTDQLIALLTNLYMAGYSHGAVADHLYNETGIKITRGIVAGKIHRLKLKRPHTGTKPVVIRERKPKPKPSAIVSTGKAIRFRKYTPSKLHVVEEYRDVPTDTDVLIPQSQRRSLLDLEPHHCRWPVGDVGTPDFFFCGADKAEGSSYCPVHRDRACATTQRAEIPSEERERRSAAAKRSWEARRRERRAA